MREDCAGKISMMRVLTFLGRGVAWLLALGIVGAGALFGGRAILQAEAFDEVAAPLPVAVFEARYQDTFEEKRAFSGRIAPAQVADSGFEVSGEVAEVLVEIGDQVEEGQALARLDPVRLELREREAAAQLADARAQFTRAQATFERVATLVEEGFATEQELDNASADRNSARERVRLLERSLARAQEDAQDTTLRAPYAGFVVARYVDRGAIVQPGQPVVRINQQAGLEAEISVPIEFARRLRVGDRFPLTAEGLEAFGVVTGVGDEIDPQTRSNAVRFSIEDDPGFIPGSLVRIALSQERRGTGVWVPIASLQESYRGLWSVYVVENEGAGEIIRRKDVEILSLGDGRVFVTGTLQDGDQVVASSPFRFVPGQMVRVETNIPAGAPIVSVSASTVQ